MKIFAGTSLRYVVLFMVSATLVALSISGPAGAEDWDLWKKKAIMGFNLTEGNSDTLNYNLSIIGRKEEEQQSLVIGIESSYGESDGTMTTDNSEIYGKYQRELNEFRYGSLWTSLLTDDAADTDYRFIISPAYGHYFIKDDMIQLKVDVGPSFIKEEVGPVEDTIFSLRAGEQYNRVLSDSAKLWQTAEFLPDFEDGEFLLNGEVGVESTLTETMNLRVVLKNRFNSLPARHKKKNDLALISSVTYDF